MNEHTNAQEKTNKFKAFLEEDSHKINWDLRPEDLAGRIEPELIELYLTKQKHHRP